MVETYVTGRACKRGHVAPRYKAQGLCTQCAKDAAARQRIEHPEVKRDSAKRCRPTAAKYHRAYSKAHPEYGSDRRTRTKAARCACCTPKQRRAVYVAARLLGKEVDHILPIRDGGLHCCKNMQLLTTVEHRLKTAGENRARFRVVA